jgi:formylglycine-generating enzyme required for sulfatase activity
MKHCPECNRTFTDDSLTSCNYDGVALIAVVVPGETLQATSAPPPTTPTPFAPHSSNPPASTPTTPPAAARRFQDAPMQTPAFTVPSMTPPPTAQASATPPPAPPPGKPAASPASSRPATLPSNQGITRRAAIILGFGGLLAAGGYGVTKLRAGSSSKPAPLVDTPLLEVPVRPTPPVVSVPPKFLRNNKDDAEMVYIPAGEFMMGSTQSEIDALLATQSAESQIREALKSEGPQHRVPLDGYYIYKFPVTVAQYLRFCAATGHTIPAAPDFNPTWTKENQPIVNVSHDDAVAYCVWASGDKPGSVRLPTEAEWEKAASWDAGNNQKRKYPWGDTFEESRLRCSPQRLQRPVSPSDVGTTPVGSYLSGTSYYGVFDMAGNVWQWCSDWYDKDFYATRQATERNPDNQTQGEKKYRVLRGGSWKCNDPINFRSAFRDSFDPTKWDDHSGFRCVLHVDAR